MSLLLRAAVVFVAMTATDIIWAKYTRHVADGRPTLAAIFSVGIVLAGGFVTLSYVNEPLMLLPMACGAYAGTWLAVRFGHRKVSS